MLTTQRLDLRAPADADYHYWTEIWNDPVNQALVSSDIISPRTAMALDDFRKQVSDDNQYMLYLSIALGRGRFIGFVTVTRPNARSRQSILTIMLHKAFWGRGYGKEAMQAVIKHCFEVNAVHRLSSSVFADNKRALNMFKKLGFVEEGRRREVYWKGPGRWEDMIDMGMLDSEYFARAA